MKLLLVEDNASDAEFLAASLRRQRATDVQLVTVQTLQDAVTLLCQAAEPPFDVVLLDLHLPDGSGLQCVDVIQGVCDTIPIVVLSGQDDEEFAVSILNKGVQDYLVKWEGQGRTILRSIRYAIERKRSELRMNYLAQFDALTGIPNRHSFSEQLNRATARARREGRKVTLLYMDLDEFKFVNDTLGHDAGDSLLKEVADRLRRSVRAGDVVARLGGDEFAIMIEGLSGPLEVEAVAEGLIKVLGEPYHIAGRQLAVTASLGITMFPSDNSDPQMLLKNADIAMYQAKEGGRNTFRFFTQRMHEELMEYHELERDMREGLVRDEFRLAFQPKVNLLTKRLQGLEALLRWTSPTRGEVGPATFIPVAEQSGHIVPLGYWVLDQVCRQITEWRAAGYPVVPVSLNVSARQFQLPDFHQRVAEAIARHGVDASLIEIEITEGLMMEDTGLAERCLDYLKSVGVRISVDDFGTGYSCLSYLHRFPIDVLKIDRSFIRQIGQGSGNEEITDAIISLARSLQLETVAEGVETTEQVDFLVTHGCHVAQGFLFGRPMDATGVEPLLGELRAWMTETTAIRRALAVGAA
ncbi:MAG: EAL domain-containing protein [Chromatiales bacterium]|jgi:diguanylate cyclase (GGDEF)-like protein|nr:EAL domain-containing protein [Chromatiales bacterium]